MAASRSRRGSARVEIDCAAGLPEQPALPEAQHAAGALPCQTRLTSAGDLQWARSAQWPGAGP
jgi:hypothetical protein